MRCYSLRGRGVQEAQPLGAASPEADRGSAAGAADRAAAHHRYISGGSRRRRSAARLGALRLKGNNMDKQHAHQLLDQLDPGQFEAVVRLWFYSIAGSVIAGYTDRIASILRRSIPRD